MKNFLMNASISFKFNAIALIGVTIILTTFGYVNYEDSKKELHSEIEKNADLIMHRLQINLPSLMWNFQTDEISQILDAELPPVYAHKIMIFEGENFDKLLMGKMVTSEGEISSVTDVGSDFSAEDAVTRTLVYSDDVGDEKNVGTALLFLDLTDLNRKLNDLLVRLVFQTVLLDIAVFVMLTLLCKFIVTGPINRVAHAMSNIAKGEGDLTQRLDKSPGEIGRLSDDFNLFVANIQGLVKSIHENMDNIVSVSKGLSETSVNTSERVQEQRSESELVATASHEMNASATSIANNVNEATEATNTSNQNIEITERVFEATISSVKQLADDIDQGATAICRVRDDVVNISSVLDVIGTIAEQTNLLALNAAIEAARAGEQGRGFAVVADEVRSLAQRTQESTGEVHRMLDLLRSGTKTAVDVIESGRGQGQTTLENASKAEESIGAITSAITQINEMNSRVANSIEEQVTVSDDISKRISRIYELTANTAEDAEKTAKDASDVLDLSTGVKRQIESLTKF